METIAITRNITLSSEEILSEVKSVIAWKNLDGILGSGSGQIHERLLLKVWDKWFSPLGNIHERNDDNLMAERIVTILMRKGIPKESITYRRNSFIVTLPNHSYRIYKREKGYAVRPVVEQRCDMRYLDYPAEDFVKDLLLFDSFIPDIEESADKLTSEISILVSEAKKANMVKQLKMSVIDSLVRECLHPLGITVKASLSEDGKNVDLVLTKTLYSHMEVPFDKLSDILKDSGAILSSLKETSHDGNQKDDALFMGLQDSFSTSDTIITYNKGYRLKRY